MNTQPEDQEQRIEAEETYYSLLAKQIYAMNRLREVVQSLQTTDNPDEADSLIQEEKELRSRLNELQWRTRHGL